MFLLVDSAFFRLILINNVLVRFLNRRNKNILSMVEKRSKIDKALIQENVKITPKEKNTIKKAEKIIEKKKLKLSHNFIYALSLVSILGFVGIISETFFEYNLHFYVESLLMLIIGMGMIFESKAKSLIAIKDTGLTSSNFTHLTTVVIGTIAIIAGIFSFPQIRIENPSFIAIKGIISVIAIIVIAIQTWVVE